MPINPFMPDPNEDATILQFIQVLLGFLTGVALMAALLAPLVVPR